MTDVENVSQVQGEEKYGKQTYTARVKWFNRTAGWGFVSLTSSAEEHNNDDVFVHWKSLDVGNEQYKYLVNGEYIHLKINYTPEGEHSYQASNVTGVDGGKLMCETRNEENDSKRSTESEGTSQQHSRQSDSPRRQRNGQSARGPREGEQWFLVKGGPGGGGRNSHHAGGKRVRQRNVEREEA